MEAVRKALKLKKNIGTTGRIIRLIIGAAILSVGLYWYDAWWGGWG